MSLVYLLEFNYSNNVVAEYLAVFVLQVLLYFVAGASVSLFYKICSKLGVGSRIELRPNYAGQIGSEIRWALGACIIIAAYFYASFSFVESVYPPNWKVGGLQVLLFVVVYDFYMYVTHRALHSRYLRKFHARHHTAVSATTWSCINLHPVETLINYLPFLVFAVYIPVSLSVLLGIHIYMIVGIANGHSNYRLVPLESAPSLLNELTLFHQKHHSDGRGNFGYLLTHWDWLLGTRHQSPF